MSVRALDAPALRRPATVVRYRCDVSNAGYLEAGRLQRTYRRLAAAARALDQDLYLSQTVLHAAPGGRLRGDTGGVRCALAGALETDGASTGPGEYVSVGIRQRDDRVVEG